jgi:hypothetical protein
MAVYNVLSEALTLRNGLSCKRSILDKCRMPSTTIKR